MNLKGMLLDIDGTLLLSNDAHARAYAGAAAEMGIEPDFAQIRSLIGKGGDKLIPEAFGFDSESAQGQQLGKLKLEIFEQRYLPSLRPTPGARDLVSRFLQNGLKVITATSATKAEAGKLLRQAGVDDLINSMVTSDDAETSKPDPDILKAAIKKIGETKEAVMMLGDTPYDVEAAERAGVRIIAVRCGGWTDRDLAGACAICDDPADVLSQYDQIFPECR